MFRFGRGPDPSGSSGPRVSTRLCTRRFNGKYPHVGVYDCRTREVWLCKALSGQAIRTSHARLITGADNATSTVWKDRFLCFWFYTPDTGEGFIHGYPIEWDEGHLLVRIDPNWDYDRQRLIPPELEDQVSANTERQLKHGETIIAFYRDCRLPYPFSVHFIGQRAADSLFYHRRFEPR
jgi:hypothetical protein